MKAAVRKATPTFLLAAVALFLSTWITPPLDMFATPLAAVLAALSLVIGVAAARKA